VAGYRKIPDFIKAAIDGCPSDEFYVGTTRAYDPGSLADGALSHLGISYENGAPTFEASLVPPASKGLWSRRNIYGRWEPLRDRPKATKYYTRTIPHFGDWSKGSHIVEIPREVWQRELWWGQQLPILVDAREESGKVVIGFRVDRVFNRSTDMPERDLLLALSLLRENLGSSDIISSTVSVHEWLEDQRVPWDILPVGGRGENVEFNRILDSLKVRPKHDRLHIMQERHEAMDGTGYAAVVVGNQEFSRYVGYRYRDDLVALENLDYGNALYLMYDNWQDLSSRTRIDLLAHPDENFDRIVHRPGWQMTLRNLLLRKGHIRGVAG
jgi:hypothetical protein